MDSSQKIYPTAEELTKVNSSVRCPEEGCSRVFTSGSNLNLHLVKTHKKEHLMKTDNTPKEYYCPEGACVYSETRFFKSLKLLKQHFLKVHTERTFQCETCEKKFPTESARNSHFEFCGTRFACCECTSSYTSYESLLTHGRRKRHKILEKSSYASKCVQEPKSSSVTNVYEFVNVNESKREQFIAPKVSTSLQLINCYRTLEKASQTDLMEGKKKNKRTLFGKKLHHQRNSQETQTLCNKKQRLTAETQTIGDYVSKSSNSEENRKSTKTQTRPVSSTTKSCNTSFDMEDFNFTNSSSTQTAIPTELIYSADLNFEFMHSSSQTSFNEDTFDSENFFNCNSETQTDFMTMLNTDYSSNMCTQTCDDILLNDMEFNNSHTQTVFDDVLRSVESQTMMSSHGSKLLLSCRDMAHMETQTDLEFKQMLEEINA